MTGDDDKLDQLLENAGAISRTSADQDAVFADVWARVATSRGDEQPTDAVVVQLRRLDVLADREKAARRRRRVTRLASATLAVVVAGGGAAAAADYLSTRTGQQNTGWQVQAGGSGEVLNLGGTDRDQVFDEVTGDIPFAPGHEAAQQWVTDFYPRESTSLISTQFLRNWFSGNAVCTWADAWVAADTAGDVAARDAATGTLAASVSWPDIVANDFPDATIYPSGEARSYYGWLPPLVAAVQAGDHQGVLDAIAGSTACSYQVIPAIDADQDYSLHGVR